MKAKIYALLTLCMLAFTFSSPMQAHAAPTEKVLTSDRKTATEELDAMKRRVEEIKAMDKRELRKTERKALKKELREMNKRARALGSGGVYLSVGAIIIIILVLILIL